MPIRESQHQQLIAIAENTPWFMHALQVVRDLGLPDWCIGAGAVRNMVWDALHRHVTPSELADIDVAYFNDKAISSIRDAVAQEKLVRMLPGVPWEVTNQAGVHLWFESWFGHSVEPLRSLEEAVASWPEYATSVGIRLEADDSLTVISPHGLDDLLAIVVRRNPVRVSLETYRQRVDSKRYSERWPKVSVVMC